MTKGWFLKKLKFNITEKATESTEYKAHLLQKLLTSDPNILRRGLILGIEHDDLLE